MLALGAFFRGIVELLDGALTSGAGGHPYPPLTLSVFAYPVDFALFMDNLPAFVFTIF